MSARFITAALVAAPPASEIAPVHTAEAHARAHLAATVATCFRGHAADPFAAQLREHALAVKERTSATLPLGVRQQAVVTARALQHLCASLPDGDRVPAMTVIVRELLAECQAYALPLDVAVREACERRYAITERHRTIAWGLLVELAPRWAPSGAEGLGAATADMEVA